MPATIDDLRAAGEADLDRRLKKLDRRHKAMLRAAIDRYERVENIPESVWDEIRRDIEEEEAAAILLLIIAADEWTTARIGEQGGSAGEVGRRQAAAYSLAAARQAIGSAASSVDTMRNRLERKVGDMQTSGPGAVGTLTKGGIDEALEDVLTQSRRATMATDATTQGFSIGQRGAAERAGEMGGDGAQTADGQTVKVELRWKTENDNRVCSRCSPLDGTYEEVWGRVFPNGPGPDAHPNCRCFLEPVVIVSRSEG